ncbi:hypothetical protein [Chishuiella changwenlii]|uniref:hypothetical protein n=1 Tax=Chishuiella changwenlii TaxID=1434701 RepID=UPI002FDB472B
MQKIFYLCALFLSMFAFCQSKKLVVTDDIQRFWNTYDVILQERDSIKQIEHIKEMYISKGTPGLSAIMQARNYTAESYIYAIRNYPKFWSTIRNNTLSANNYAKKIEKGLKKFNKIYPEAKPAKIYFTIGALRTNGTTMQDKVLIGAEVAMTDTKTYTEEIKNDFPYLINYFNTNPINDLEFLNVHEYIHTQQKSTIGNSLLAQTMMEGAAEFLTEVTLKTKSPNPQIEFGFKNEEKIKQEYSKEMFSPNVYNWLWNSPDNQFKMRDLGYFVGYAICKKYYEQAENKNQAIKDLIELDYNNENDLISLVDKANYFKQSVINYKKEYENNRPYVTKIEQFENGNQHVDSSIKQLTIHFSQPMNKNFRSFELGPLGEKHLIRITKVIGFSEDGKSLSLEINLEPNKQLQLIIDKGFRNTTNYHLKPYLIDIKTNK